MGSSSSSLLDHAAIHALALYQPASGLTKLALFQEYVKAHSLSPATFGLSADWKPPPLPRSATHRGGSGSGGTAAPRTKRGGKAGS